MNVYFIAGGGKTKVGITMNDPMRRLAQLQTASPAKLRLVCFVPDSSHELERMVHHVLRDRHSHGEWFHGEVDQAEAQGLVDQSQVRLKQLVFPRGGERKTSSLPEPQPRRSYQRSDETRRKLSEAAKRQHAATAKIRAYAKRLGVTVVVAQELLAQGKLKGFVE